MKKILFFMMIFLVSYVYSEQLSLCGLVPEMSFADIDEIIERAGGFDATKSTKVDETKERNFIHTFLEDSVSLNIVDSVSGKKITVSFDKTSLSELFLYFESSYGPCSRATFNSEKEPVYAWINGPSVLAIIKTNNDLVFASLSNMGKK